MGKDLGQRLKAFPYVTDTRDLAIDVELTSMEDGINTVVIRGVVEGIGDLAIRLTGEVEFYSRGASDVLSCI
jgi:hypothetical protein